MLKKSDDRPKFIRYRVRIAANWRGLVLSISVLKLTSYVTFYIVGYNGDFFLFIYLVLYSTQLVEKKNNGILLLRTAARR